MSEERYPSKVFFTYNVDAVEVIRCKDCKHYKDSEVEDRKMCFRKDVDGMPVCYDFKPNDWCRYGERKEQ